MGNLFYISRMKEKKTGSVKIDKDLLMAIKEYISPRGQTISSFIELTLAKKIKYVKPVHNLQDFE